jgi:hypothetical protein
MGKSIHPMFTFLIRGEACSGSAPSLIVWMSLQPAIPWRVALLHCPSLLNRLDSIFHPPAGTVNHHLTGAGEFSTGRMRNFQPELTVPCSGQW